MTGGLPESVDPNRYIPDESNRLNVDNTRAPFIPMGSSDELVTWGSSSFRKLRVYLLCKPGPACRNHKHSFGSNSGRGNKCGHSVIPF